MILTLPKLGQIWKIPGSQHKTSFKIIGIDYKEGTITRYWKSGLSCTLSNFFDRISDGFKPCD